MALTLEIVTPEARVYSDTIDTVVIPTTEGEIGILPGHIPLLTRIADGELRVTKGGVEAHLVELSGSVEIMVSLGVADAIVDLVETGSTLAANRLRVLDDIGRYETVLVQNGSVRDPATADRIVRRLEGIVIARNWSLLEYNVRFGDPEAEVLLAALDVDLAPLLLSLAEGKPLPTGLRFNTSHKVAAVVVAAAGYPHNPEAGATINGVYAAERQVDARIFCAGVARDGLTHTVNGGRVITVTGRGATFEAALKRAYRAVDQLSFEGMQVRRDIGHSVLRRH
jgi:F0F1-type ATP synthase epsilon subunit